MALPGVVIGSDDPNPLVAGKGIEILRSQGVQVTTHFLQEECDKLNEVFFHFIQTKTPYVVMKYAMTLDGKIATKTGASQWITGEIAGAGFTRTAAVTLPLWPGWVRCWQMIRNLPAVSRVAATRSASSATLICAPHSPPRS